MGVRNLLRRIRLARQIYFRTWLFRYLEARSSRSKSFAQAGEDLKLGELIGGVRWFVDIGAHDGISGSNTLYFALRGARGICFEPCRETYTKLNWLYGLNWRVKRLNCGISDVSRRAEIISADFCSYLPETEDPGPRRENVTVFGKEQVTLLRFEDAVSGITLPSVCDLLSVDVEGHELNVLRSIPFERYTFRAIVVETHLIDDDDNCIWRHRDLAELEALLAERGYDPVHRSWVNTIYLHKSVPRRTCAA
jgi:FkbM family methyltransferase